MKLVTFCHKRNKKTNMRRQLSLEFIGVIFIALCGGIQCHYGNPIGSPHEAYRGYIFAQWSDCIGATSCTQGIRHRRYNGPGFRHKLQFEVCNEICPVDGGYSEWMSWSSCSVSCGEGVETRKRFCVDPVPDNYGKVCENGTVEEDFRTCNLRECDPSVYSEWTEYFSCSASCGYGTRTRNRLCLDKNMMNCVNGTMETDTPVPCKIRDCVDGGYIDWTEWTDCSATCGAAIRQRERYCIDPVPVGGARCMYGNVDSEFESCSYTTCTASTTTTTPIPTTTTTQPTTTTTTPIPPPCNFNQSAVPKDTCYSWEGNCYVVGFTLKNQTKSEVQSFCGLLSLTLPAGDAALGRFLNEIYQYCPSVSAFTDTAACMYVNVDNNVVTNPICDPMQSLETITVCG